VIAKTITTISAQIAAVLRASVLQLKPADIGLVDAAGTVWGVVIETAYPDAVASLIVLADGSVSLYMSDGSGCVGCGSHQEVRGASADLLQIAENSLPLTVATDDMGLPLAGLVRFYLLAGNGLRCAQTRIEDIHTIDARLAVLYFAGQRVLTTIEKTGAGQSLTQEIRAAQDAMQEPAFVKDVSRDAVQGDEQCLSVGNAVRRLRT